MDEIVRALAHGLTERGWHLDVIEVAPLSARLSVTDACSAAQETCEVDVLKEVFTRPAASSAYGPVLAEEDVIGTKVRALGSAARPATSWMSLPPHAAGSRATLKNSAAVMPASVSTWSLSRPV